MISGQLPVNKKVVMAIIPIINQLGITLFFFFSFANEVLELFDHMNIRSII
jgi:hypothetical protein